MNGRDPRDHQATEVDEVLALPQPPAPVPVDEAAPLVERCRRGDQLAYRELFERYHERVYATIYHLVSRKDELEDVVQKVFLEVHRSLHRFEGRARFTTWLTRVAIHVAHGHERKLRLFDRSRQAAAERARESFTVIDGGQGAPDEKVAQRERAVAARALIARLSPKKRAVLILAEMLEMSAPEIADVLDVPPATVRTRLFYARRDFERLARKHPVFAPLWQGEEAP